MRNEFVKLRGNRNRLSAAVCLMRRILPQQVPTRQTALSALLTHVKAQRTGNKSKKLDSSTLKSKVVFLFSSTLQLTPVLSRFYQETRIGNDRCRSKQRNAKPESKKLLDSNSLNSSYKRWILKAYPSGINEFNFYTVTFTSFSPCQQKCHLSETSV